jgi:hypothetical protein
LEPAAKDGPRRWAAFDPPGGSGDRRQTKERRVTISRAAFAAQGPSAFDFRDSRFGEGRHSTRSDSIRGRLAPKTTGVLLFDLEATGVLPVPRRRACVPVQGFAFPLKGFAFESRRGWCWSRRRPTLGRRPASRGLRPHGCRLPPIRNPKTTELPPVPHCHGSRPQPFIYGIPRPRPFRRYGVRRHGRPRLRIVRIYGIPRQPNLTARASPGPVRR